ncbi:DNA/RNA nuclease SfsA [uncultured Gemmiger sp.]|uniref:DNA/RNA nuclease SfsA n=1 Tax=uncultured Gemmiger sp. TaxID=1623490 RepID=UPI0025D5BBD6|nr:DNA/RNA nuclease SfsA [uncultured Gemmiger sp.]
MILYHKIRPAVFRRRPNRFVACVTTGDGAELRAHVKNTGRCAELLVPGARVYLEFSDRPGRSTPCDLVAVEKSLPGGSLLVNMDSAAPNAAAGEWLAAGGLGPLEQLRPEQTFGDSRFDFAARQGGRPVLVEVKGCTLERAGVAAFPDAPTLRGLKHVRALTGYARQGWRCCILVVIQMDRVDRFCPNWATQPAFGLALQEAAAAGVEVLAMDCAVTPTSVTLRRPVPVDLTPPPDLR